jgi:hypothetical protein
MNATESRLFVERSLGSFRPVQPVFQPVERPWAMSIACLLGFLQCTISAIAVLIVIPGGVPFLVGMALVGVQAVCLSGLWRMRVWSLPAYVALTVLVQVLAAIGGGFSLLGLLLPAATIVVGLMNVDHME